MGNRLLVIIGNVLQTFKDY